MAPFQQIVWKIYDYNFFIDLVYGIVWLDFLVFGSQPGLFNIKTRFFCLLGSWYPFSYSSKSLLELKSFFLNQIEMYQNAYCKCPIFLLINSALKKNFA